MELSNPRTPIHQDKRFMLSAGTILSLLLARYLGVHLEPELLVTIATVVVGHITGSAAKEAAVAKANAAAYAAQGPKTLAELANEG